MILHYAGLVAAGIFVVFAFVLAFIGRVDAGLAHFMSSYHISPQWQLYILLVATVVLVVLALRLLGGLLGWAVLILLVLLLLHRVVPDVGNVTALQHNPLDNVFDQLHST